MQFEFATANRIVFGAGAVKKLGGAAKSFGGSALVVLGGSGARARGSLEQLRKEGLAVREFHVSGEPTIGDVLEGVNQAREGDCDVVVGIGGGSVLDTGKAIAALIRNPGAIYDYLEVVGKGQVLALPAAPYIAVPTTAGSGSEVTRNAVLAVSDRRVKVSMRSPFLLPRLAIVDPELTYSLPPAETATSGLDALTQVVEPFLSRASNPMTDAVCREGMRRIVRSLKAAYNDGSDVQAREDMCVGSLMGGMALANAKLGAVHGFAGPIGGMFSAPHGAVCARLLPIVMDVNLRALRRAGIEAGMLERYTEVARTLTTDPEAPPEAGIMWLRALCESLEIPPLGSYGVHQADFPEIIERARNSSSMRGNPVESDRPRPQHNHATGLVSGIAASVAPDGALGT